MAGGGRGGVSPTPVLDTTPRRAYIIAIPGEPVLAERGVSRRPTR